MRAFEKINVLGYGRAAMIGALSMVIASTVGCRQKNEEKHVSVSSRCLSFDLKKSESRALSGELPALRAMRDFSMECLPSEQSGQALRWAELAAEKGDRNDKKVWKDLQEIFGRKSAIP